MPFGFVAAAVGVSAVAGAYSANKAAKTQKKAIKGQIAAAADQAAVANRQVDIADQELELAQEQWSYNRDVYMPKALDMADEAAAQSKMLADRAISDSDFNRGLAVDATTQAKKSWKYQDEYMAMTDKYTSGQMGEEMAAEANADVEQANVQQRGISQRNMQRMGVSAGSGAGLAMAHDDQNAAALSAAGAQTNARQAARDKAEQMVGIAAGSGAAGFGTGLSASGLATGATNTALNATNSGAEVLNRANAGINANFNGTSNSFGQAGAGMAQAGAGFRGVANTWNSLQGMNNGSLVADSLQGSADSFASYGMSSYLKKG